MSNFQKIQGVITGTDVDSAGRSFAIVQPADGSLAAFVYGVPKTRKGGPEHGQVIDMLVIPGSLARNFTYAGVQAVDLTEAFAAAKAAETGKRTAAAAVKLTDADKAERAAKREQHRKALQLAEAADKATATPAAPVEIPAPAGASA